MRIENRPQPAQSAAPIAPSSDGSARFRDVVGRRTPLDPGDAARHLARAWEEVHGKAPSARTVSILWAQWALETGRGQSMHGYNFGGLKGEAPGGGSVVTWTREGFGAEERRIRSRFRAYASPEEGAVDYVRTLAERYPEASRAAAAGETDRFVSALDAARYFTADPGAYRRSVGALVREIETQGPNRVRPLSVETPGPALDMLLWTLARATSKKGA